MIRLIHKIISRALGIAGGIVAGVIFKRVWKLAAHDDKAPKPVDAERGWREILLAAAAQGAIVATIRAAVDRTAAIGTKRLTGSWPAAKEKKKKGDKAKKGKAKKREAENVPASTSKDEPVASVSSGQPA